MIFLWLSNPQISGHQAFLNIDYLDLVPLHELVPSKSLGDWGRSLKPVGRTLWILGSKNPKHTSVLGQKSLVRLADRWISCGDRSLTPQLK